MKTAFQTQRLALAESTEVSGLTVCSDPTCVVQLDPEAPAYVAERGTHYHRAQIGR